MWKEAVDMGISVHSGPIGELGVGSFNRDLERCMKEGSGNRASLCGSSMRGTWMGGFFTGDPEGFVKEDSGNGRLFP